MSIAEKLSQLYQECKMNSLLKLLEEKQEDLKYQQKQISKAFDESAFSSQKPVNDAIARKKRIIDEIAMIKSQLPQPKTYGFKKSVKKSVKKTKKSPKKSAKKSPKKAKKSPKKTKKC